MLLVEGPTEKTLLPDTIKAITGETLSGLKMGLLRLDGSGGTAKCLEILKAMDIRGKAVVDLDFAFRQAVRSNYF